MSLSQPSVLCVDDNAANRYWLRRVLERAALQVQEAQTGAEGLTKARSDVDLVVLDVSLPDISGMEVCRILKSDPQTSGIPVLHLSAARIDSHARVEGLDSGADAYLVQPVQPDELVATVKSLLRARVAEEKARRVSIEWETTFNAINDPVCVVNADDTVSRCNRALCDLLSKPLAEIVGRNYREIIRTVLGEGEDAPTREALEIVVTMRQKGERVELRVPAPDRLLYLVADPTGEGAVLLFSDVTARRRMEEDRVAAREHVLRVVAHDLRNPLSVVILNAERLIAELKNLTDPAPWTKRLKAIDRAARRMQGLTNGMLDLARLEHGRISLTLRPSVVEDLLADAAEGFASTADQKNIRIAQDCPASLTVQCDRERVEQVLSNLLGNALKFSPRETTVSLIARDDGTFVRVSVSDAGKGIAPDHLPHIFEAYWQAGPGGDGLGLGLSIAKALVEAHGGSLSARSVLGAGTTFEFTLPKAA